MPKLFVFAIGGTGERVMRSLTMMLAAGVNAFNKYEVYPIIIDYDEKNADKDRTVELLRNYAAVHNAAFDRQGWVGEDKVKTEQFFSAKLRQLPGLDNYVFPYKPEDGKKQFKEHIGFEDLSGENIMTKELLASLYDTSDRPDTELNLDMTVGFKGNPNIGSVVFNKIAESLEFRAFKSAFQPATDRVVVIGSIFGGTGASGIPEIVKAIHAMNKGAKVAALLVLPYFAPAETRGGAIQASRFNAKSKAALTYYKSSGLMDMITDIYCVGDPIPTVMPYSEGGITQMNNANIVEFIAAAMIEHFCTRADSDTKNEFKFSLDADIWEDEDAVERSAKRLFIEDFDTYSKENIMSAFIEFSLALKLFHEQIQTKKAKVKDFWNLLDMDEAAGFDKESENRKNRLRDYCVALDSFYAKYVDWLKELDFEGDGDAKPANSHRLALTNLSNRYSDIIVKPANDGDEEEAGGFVKFGKAVSSVFSSGKEPVTDDTMVTSLNVEIKDKGDTGHYDTKKNAIRVGHHPEFVFADILHKAAVTAREDLLKTKR